MKKELGIVVSEISNELNWLEVRVASSLEIPKKYIPKLASGRLRNCIRDIEYMEILSKALTAIKQRNK